MNINIIEEPHFSIVQVEGELDASSSVQLDDSLQEVLNENNTSILVDFNSLEYISSPGIGVFTSRIEDCQKADIHIVLYGMKEKVFSVFKILGLDQLLPIVNTKEQAKERLDELQNQS